MTSTTLILYRGDVRSPGQGFLPVSSFVDDLADAEIAAETAIVRQGGVPPIYRCTATIPTATFLDARSDLTALLGLIGPPATDEALFNHVHTQKEALIAIGYTWVAFPQQDDWVEYVYLAGDTALPAERVPWDDVRDAAEGRSAPTPTVKVQRT